MNSQPLVSIVLPTYNGERYLRESIDSCIAQTYSAWELIIVDDYSSDSTPEIATNYSQRDARIRVIRNEANRRLPGALNTGFAAARGELLTWTSDDNLYEPEALEMMNRHLAQQPEIDFVYCQMKRIDEHGSYLGPGWMAAPCELDRQNCVGACFLYRRNVYEQLGDYAEDMVLAEDYEYWLRIRRSCQMAFLSDIAPYRYRQHGGSLTGRRFLDILWQCSRARAKHAPDKRAAHRILTEGLLEVSWHARRLGEHGRAFRCAVEAVASSPVEYKPWKALLGSMLIGSAHYFRIPAETLLAQVAGPSQTTA